MPLQSAGLGIARFQVSGNIKIVATHAHDHVILDNHRRHRAVIHLIRIADLLPPALLPGGEVERNEMTVGGLKIEPVAGYSYAAISDVYPALRFPGVVPDFAS